jgi:hypothetical protein
LGGEIRLKNIDKYIDAKYEELFKEHLKNRITLEEIKAQEVEIEKCKEKLQSENRV